MPNIESLPHHEVEQIPKTPESQENAESIEERVDKLRKEVENAVLALEIDGEQLAERIAMTVGATPDAQLLDELHAINEEAKQLKTKVNADLNIVLEMNEKGEMVNDSVAEEGLVAEKSERKEVDENDLTEQQRIFLNRCRFGVGQIDDLTITELDLSDRLLKSPLFIESIKTGLLNTIDNISETHAYMKVDKFIEAFKKSYKFSPEILSLKEVREAAKEKLRENIFSYRSREIVNFLDISDIEIKQVLEQVVSESISRSDFIDLPTLYSLHGEFPVIDIDDGVREKFRQEIKPIFSIFGPESSDYLMNYFGVKSEDFYKNPENTTLILKQIKEQLDRGQINDFLRLIDAANIPIDSLEFNIAESAKKGLYQLLSFGDFENVSKLLDAFPFLKDQIKDEKYIERAREVLITKLMFSTDEAIEMIKHTAVFGEKFIDPSIYMVVIDQIKSEIISGKVDNIDKYLSVLSLSYSNLDEEVRLFVDGIMLADKDIDSGFDQRSLSARLSEVLNIPEDRFNSFVIVEDVRNLSDRFSIDFDGDEALAIDTQKNNRDTALKKIADLPSDLKDKALASIIEHALDPDFGDIALAKTLIEQLSDVEMKKVYDSVDIQDFMSPENRIKNFQERLKEKSKKNLENILIKLEYLMENDTKEKMHEKIKEVNETMEFTVNVPVSAVKMILDSGRFKSCWETKNRDYEDYRDRRDQTEKKMGIRGKGTQNDPHPIYAGLAFGDEVQKGVDSSYGAVVIVLNKERLKDRTSCTYGDSFSIPNPRDEIYSFDDFSTVKTLQTMSLDVRYVEVQIQGVTTVEDIQAINIPKSELAMLGESIDTLKSKYPNITFNII